MPPVGTNILGREKSIAKAPRQKQAESGTDSASSLRDPVCLVLDGIPSIQKNVWHRRDTGEYYCPQAGLNE